MAVYATGILVFGSSLLILAGATIISNSNRINLRFRVWGRSHNHSSLALVFNSVAISVCGGCSRVGGLCFISGQFLHWLPLVSLQQITTTISTAARGIRITGGAAWIKIYSAIYHLSGAVTILFKSVLTALWRILKLPADVLYDAVVFLFSSKWSTLAGGITLLAVALKYETFLPYIISAWSHCSECGANGMITLWRYVQTAPPIRIWSAVGCHILAHTPVIKASSLHALQHAIITLNSALDPVKSPMAMFGSPLFLASLEGVILGVHFVADPWADLYNRLPWLGGRTLHQSIIYRDRLTWVTIMRARSKLFIFPIFALRGIFMAFSALNLLVLFVGLSYFSYVILLMNNVVFMYLLLVVFCIFIYFYYIMAELNMLLSEANYDQFLIIDQGQQGQDFESIRRRDQQNNQALGT